MTDLQRYKLRKQREMAENEEKIIQVMHQILAHTKGEAHDWAIDLARLLNQTESCRNCEGEGWVRKHKNCNHNPHDMYCLGCDDHRDCKKCGGTGRALKAIGKVQP